MRYEISHIIKNKKPCLPSSKSLKEKILTIYNMQVINYISIDMNQTFEIGCRFCGNTKLHSFCNLGHTPPSNAYLFLEDLQKPEIFYPLHAYICPKCYLVQLPNELSSKDLFQDYSYFSSYSSTWLNHCQKFAKNIIERFHFDSKNLIVEIGSNDGYLLQFFKKHHIPILGIEPAENVAHYAIEKGIPTVIEFFGTTLANQLKNEGKLADLIIGNNVLAHVPNLNDFIKGMKILLNPKGLIVMEFPHLLRLLENIQFDTIYHEHFSYFSFLTIQKIFTTHGLFIFDVEEISTHGGSIRIYAKHKEDLTKTETFALNHLQKKEKEFGIECMKTYFSFQNKVDALKNDLFQFLSDCKKKKKKIVGYGAPAKGNTLLNYCKIDPPLLPFTVDISPHKQNRFLPGTHIPIKHPNEIEKVKPDYLLILPWNLKEEIIEQMRFIRSWGAQFVQPIPKLKIIK